MAASERVEGLGNVALGSAQSDRMRLPAWFAWSIRILLALVFGVYGSVKLAGNQFWHGPFEWNSATDNPVYLVWGFFGRSYVYSTFIGLGELVPSLLLLHPRTTLLGALGLLPVSLNVVLIDWCYGFPEVRFFAIGYFVLVCLLLWHDRARLLRLIER